MKKFLFISLFTMLLSVSFVSAETSTALDGQTTIEKSIATDTSTAVTAERSIASDEAAVEESDDSSGLPSWLDTVVTPVINFVINIPKVGPVLIVIIKWVAVLSGVMTALSAFLQAIATVLIAIGGWAGAQSFADKVASISNKILPWLKYFSMFNVQKS